MGYFTRNLVHRPPLAAALPVLLLGLLFLVPCLAAESSATTSPPSSTAPPGLTRLFAVLASSPGLEARFTEVKKISLMKAPQRKNGTIHFAPPDLLVQRGSGASPSILIIDSEKLKVQRGERRKTIDLKAQPGIEAVTRSMSAIFRGDLARLRASFDLEWSEGPSGWALKLRPRHGPMNRVIQLIELKGEEEEVHQLRVVELSGDETKTSYTNVLRNRTYTTIERDRLKKGLEP